MQCRSCGTEIADKALICYKCGTATTEAKYQPAPIGRKTSRSGAIATVIALVLVVLLAVVLGRRPGGETPSAVTYGAVAVAVVIVGLRAYARRRR
jgi:O-antigen/teichoic acid export membrane protein